MPKRRREVEEVKETTPSNIYVENSKAGTVISDKEVQAALEANFGKDTKLKTWRSGPFMKTPGCFTTFVTSIQVQFQKGNQTGVTTYMVKSNPLQPQQYGPNPPDCLPHILEKEGKFYSEILPELNNCMTEIGQKLLPYPKCYYAQYVHGKELLIFEDLHLKGFKMIDLRKGMDLPHAILVIQGLACLHAASKLMLIKNSIDDLKSRYPFLFHEFWAGKMIENVVAEGISIGKETLSIVGCHESAINWLDMVLANIYKFFEMNYANCPQFNVICHGDCWNNIYFRYNDTGLPVEVMLMNLQESRFASLATDLNYFMFTSMMGSIRRPNIGRLLTEYYTSFSSVIEGGGQYWPFTLEELVQEYKKKNGYGLIFGTVIIPPLLMEMKKLDLDYVTPENIHEVVKEWQQYAMASLDKNPLYRSRFVAMYDEMLEDGLFTF